MTESEDQPLLTIRKKANVKFIPMPKQEEWRKKGGMEPEDVNEDDCVNFWYRFHYIPGSARFEYVEPLKKENNPFIPKTLEKEDTETLSGALSHMTLTISVSFFSRP